jgi:hypothetical protein
MMALLFVLALVQANPASAISIGLIDTFEDGTTQGWVVGVALGAVHPAPPANVASGGPAGVDDNYLLLTAVGGELPGGRLSVLNLAQWSGDYTATGVAGISMDLRNLGNTDLAVRLYLENPMVGPPTDDAVSDEALLPAGGDWTSVFFPVGAGNLSVINGDANTLLSNVTALRIIHNPGTGFPPLPVVAQLGVDNIRTVGRVVPEPGIALLLLAGLTALAARRRATAKGAP